MTREIEIELNAKIAEFKSVAWKDAIDELNSHLPFFDMRVLDFDDIYLAGMELLKRNESFLRINFFFRFFRPTERYPYWHVRPIVSVIKGGMEMSGLERRYLSLDREISEISGPDIYHMVRSLIRIYELAR